MKNQVLWYVMLFCRGNAYQRLEDIKILRNVCACSPGDKKQRVVMLETLATLLWGYEIWTKSNLEH